jgi:hypothetical protein
MNVLPIFIGFGLVIAAVGWSTFIGPNRKKRERWNQLTLPAARSG